MTSNTMLDTGSVPVVVAEGGTGISSATAYAILCGGTTSTAAIQPLAALGASGTVLTSNGAGALPSMQAIGVAGGFTLYNVVAFLAAGAGTYTPTSGMKYCIVYALGAGGAGGGTPTASASNGACGGGGGSGGLSIGIFSAATIGASQSLNISSGGSGVSNGNGNNGGSADFGAFGTLMQAKGGTGGLVGGSSSSSNQKNGGAGAISGTGGFVNFTGNSGFPGYSFIGSSFQGGNGAPSAFSGGAQGPTAASSSAAGVNAIANTGAGGSGSVISAVTGTNLAGGNGGSASIIIYEFC